MAKPKTINELNAWFTANIGTAPEGYAGTPEQWTHEVKASYEKGMAALGYGHEGLEPIEPTPDVPIGEVDLPAIEEQIEAMPQISPEAITEIAPELGPIPEVTPAPTVGAPTVPTIPGVTPAPVVPGTTVAPAPEYMTPAQQKEWADMLSGEIRETIEMGGRGIPEETQAQMIQRARDPIMAREAESLRVMKNNMERRGVTNSGFIFAGEQSIKAGTTVAIANSIRDVQIQSSLMKMASFENALGHAGQFLGYLSEQTKMAYTGKMATWSAQNQVNLVQYQSQIATDLDQWKMVNQFNLTDWEANKNALFAQWDKNSSIMVEEWKMENQFNLAEWGAQGDWDMALFQVQTEALFANISAQMDVFKMGISQAYQQGNMVLLAQINANAAAVEQAYDLQILQIKMEAEERAAAQEGFFNLLGTILGFAFGGI